MSVPNHTLPLYCVECKRFIRDMHVSREVASWEKSHGLCAECGDKLDMKLFGKSAADVEALR